MKKLLFTLSLILIVFCCNAQTEFNYIFSKCIKPQVGGKTDTTVVDTIYITNKFANFTFNEFKVNPFFFDSVSNKVAIFAVIQVKLKPITANNFVRTSSKIFPSQYNVVTMYTASPVESNLFHLNCWAKNFIVETRIVKANTAAPTAPCYYLYYKINGTYLIN